MRKVGQRVLMIAGVAVLACSGLLAQDLVRSNEALAQLPTRTPTDVALTPLTPPANTPEPTETPEPTDTPEPSDTPEPTETEEPTETPKPTKTGTPTNTATATSTATSTHTSAPTSAATAPNTPTSTHTSTAVPTSPGPEQTDEPNRHPECQSVVEGYVIGAAGQPVNGATVIIEGEGFSRRILSDDSGHFGFGGLCAGTATLRAYLPSGQPGGSAQLSLTGKNSIRLDLNAAPAGTSLVSGGATAQQTVLPAADLPETGHSGWLLAGGALLGALLLLLAGVRRTLSVQERTQDHH